MGEMDDGLGPFEWYIHLMEQSQNAHYEAFVAVEKAQEVFMGGDMRGLNALRESARLAHLML